MYRSINSTLNLNVVCVCSGIRSQEKNPVTKINRAVDQLRDYNSKGAQDVHADKKQVRLWLGLRLPLWVRVLHMPLTYKIFDRYFRGTKIVHGEIVELRAARTDWDAKLEGKHYDVVCFTRGYKESNACNRLWFTVDSIWRIPDNVDSCGMSFEVGDWGIVCSDFLGLELTREYVRVSLEGFDAAAQKDVEEDTKMTINF